MFDNLIESRPRKKKSPGQIAVSVVFHGLIIFAAVKATAGAAETLQEVLQDTTMVFLEPPKATPPPPPPENVVVVANPPPQGFQTVVPPENIPTEIPPVNLNERFDPKDFTGKGVEGGIATGVAGGTGPVPTVGDVFLIGQVDDVPVPVSIPPPRYPPIMERAGIPGKVKVQFIVDTTGHMEPGSFKVVNSTNKAFEEPARESLQKAVFKPGKSRGTPVRVLVELPISFNPGQ